MLDVASRTPGFLSVKAAAHVLGIRQRSVRELIERGRLRSSRLGRLHFVSTRAVESYRRARRARQRQAALRRAG
jgi:excisionase family DNA binding protein